MKKKNKKVINIVLLLVLLADMIRYFFISGYSPGEELEVIFWYGLLSYLYIYPAAILFGLMGINLLIPTLNEEGKKIEKYSDKIKMVIYILIYILLSFPMYLASVISIVGFMAPSTPLEITWGWFIVIFHLSIGIGMPIYYRKKYYKDKS